MALLGSNSHQLRVLVLCREKDGRKVHDTLQHNDPFQCDPALDLRHWIRRMEGELSAKTQSSYQQNCAQRLVTCLTKLPYTGENASAHSCRIFRVAVRTVGGY